MKKSPPSGGAEVGSLNNDCNREPTRFRHPSQQSLIRDLWHRGYVECLHRLGPGAVDELLIDIGAERSCLMAIKDKLASYANFDPGLTSAAVAPTSLIPVTGENLEPARFSTWTLKTIASIGDHIGYVWHWRARNGHER